MLKVFMLPYTEKTVLENLNRYVIETINNKLIGDKDLYYYFKTNYSKESLNIDDNIFDNTIGGPTLDIEYNLTTLEDSFIKNMLQNPNNKVILYDKDIKLSARTLYISKKIEYDFTYRSQSRTNVLAFIHKLNMLLSSFKNTLIIDNVVYDYYLPKTLYNFFTDVKNLKGLTDVSTIDYINSISLIPVDAAIKPVGKYKIPVFRNRVSELVLLLNQDRDIKPVRNESNEYEVNFRGELHFKCPVAISVKYPIKINNKLLPRIWLTTNTIVKPVPKLESEIDVSSVLKEIYKGDYIRPILITIPEYDDITELDLPNNNLIYRVFSINITFNPEDITLLTTIDELKQAGIPDYITDYIKDYYTGNNDMFKYGGGLILGETFIDKYKKDLDVYINDVGEIRLLTPPNDINKTFRLIIGFNRDIGSYWYYGKDIERLKRDISILNYLNIPIVKPFNPKLGKSTSVKT